MQTLPVLRLPLARAASISVALGRVGSELVNSAEQGTYGNTFTGTGIGTGAGIASEGITICSLLYRLHQPTGNSTQGNTNAGAQHKPCKRGRGMKPAHTKGNTRMRQSNQQRFQVPKAGLTHQSRGFNKG